MLSALAPALSFLTPLCAIALVLRYKPALHASFVLLGLSLSAITSGVVDLTNAGQAQLVVKTCLYAQLGASAIYLAHRYKGYSFVLTGFLFCGTVLGLATPFVLAIPTIVPPLLFLLFTLSTLPLLAHNLFSKIRTTPIAQVPIPPPLPSPSASSVTSFPSSDDKHEIASSACSTSFPYKSPPLASAETGSTAAPHTGIRHRAQIIQSRSRNIILTLLASQLLILLSDALFLIAALIPHSQAIKSIQTFFLVLSICGFMFAFVLHGQRLPINPSTTPPSTRISISVSISKRQDQPNSTFPNSNPDHHTDSTARPRAKPHSDDNVDNHHRGVNTGDCPDHLPPWKNNCLFSQPSESRFQGRLQGRLGTGLGLSLGLGSSGGDDSGVGRFRRFRKIFGVKGSGPSEGEEQESAISLKNLHHPQVPTTQNHRHTRFVSPSSSFSSPPRYNQNDSQPRVPTPDIQTHGADTSRLEEGKEDEKKFDDVEDGVELPIPLPQTRSDSASIGQLPSPPDTPRARVHSSTTTTSTTTHVPYTYSNSHLSTTYYQRQNNTISSSTAPDIVTVITTTDHDDNSSNKEEEEEEVRIGMVTSAEKPNLTIRDIFIDAEQYEEACERGEVVDSAVSEPGHGSREYFDFGEENLVHNSPRVLVLPPSSTPTPTPTPALTPIPTPVLRSPTFSSPSSWMTNNFKRPMKSRSMMSLPLSFGSGSGSATDTRSPRSPTLSWKGAEKLKEKLKRPLGSGGHGRALSLSQSPTLGHSAGKEDGFVFVKEGGERDSGGKGQHKRKGSTWSSLGQKSPTFLFTSNVPATATSAATTSTSASSGSEWEWYPSFSKSKLKPKSSTTNLHNHQGEVLTSSISNKKKREQTATPVLTAPRPSYEQHQQQPMSDTADFVDLTDPFASPTPGFALPKWVGNNGSSVTAGSGASGSVGPCGLGVGGNWNGSVSDVGHGGYCSSGGGGGASSSWCHDSGGENYHDVYVNEKETTPTMSWNVPKTIKSRSGAQWGKLPPVPPIPSSSLSDQGHYGYDGLKKKQERLGRVPPVATAMATGGGKRTRPSRRRPDSPMPMKMLLSGTTAGSLMRVVDDAEDEDGDREMGEGERGILERPGSPVPHSLSRSPSPSPLTLATAMELGIKRDVRVLGSTVVIDNTLDVLRGGRLQKKNTNTTTDPNAENHISSPNSRKGSSGMKNGGVKPRRGRNGSPVPIPFRRNKSHRHAGNSNGRGAGVLEEESKEEADADVVDGLNLEEMLLAQRLLRRLNSDEGSM